MLDLVDADAEDAVSFTSAASADSPKGYGGYGHANGTGGQTWERVRAAIRYVTQKPWNRIPPITRTLIYNPVLACLAGGRNKARRALLAPDPCPQQCASPLTQDKMFGLAPGLHAHDPGSPS